MRRSNAASSDEVADGGDVPLGAWPDVEVGEGADVDEVADVDGVEEEVGLASEVAPPAVGAAALGGAATGDVAALAPVVPEGAAPVPLAVDDPELALDAAVASLPPLVPSSDCARLSSRCARSAGDWRPHPKPCPWPPPSPPADRRAWNSWCMKACIAWRTPDAPWSSSSSSLRWVAAEAVEDDADGVAGGDVDAVDDDACVAAVDEVDGLAELLPSLVDELDAVPPVEAAGATRSCSALFKASHSSSRAVGAEPVRSLP
jgi:hypothetical protein